MIYNPERHVPLIERRWNPDAVRDAIREIMGATRSEISLPRHSLWTGDQGLAIFLRDVLREKARMPGIDFV